MLELAKLFEQMCVGEYNGHMAAVPHNPTIKAIFDAMGDGDFADKLNKLAGALQNDPKRNSF